MEMFSRLAETPEDMKLRVEESAVGRDASNWYMSLNAEGGFPGRGDFNRKLRINYEAVWPLRVKERRRQARMRGSLEACIAELNRLRLDYNDWSVSEEAEMFIDGLHLEIMS